MKAHLPDKPTPEQMDEWFRNQMALSAGNGVVLGGQSHAKILMENWGADYLAAKTQKDKLRLADAIVAYAKRTAEGNPETNENTEEK